MEANLQSNFNVGFTNMKSDILIHLTQWQYWWWFWFSLLWAFYYLMILKMVRFRSLKFRPRIATTFRPHGKWGDLIVCIIPVSWCANIITNSNFILRMIEWQSESGLLTVRIRGKQWYWVYKFELKTFTDVFTVPKNIGHNKWQITTPNDLQVTDDYLHMLQLRSHNRWVKTYWEELTQEISKSKNFSLISSQEQLRYNIYKGFEDDVIFSRLNSLNSFFDLDSDIVIVPKFLLDDFDWLRVWVSPSFDNSPSIELFEECKTTDLKNKSYKTEFDLKLKKTYDKLSIFKNSPNIFSKKFSNKEPTYSYESFDDFRKRSVTEYINFLEIQKKKNGFDVYGTTSEMDDSLGMSFFEKNSSSNKDVLSDGSFNFFQKFKKFLRLVTSYLSDKFSGEFFFKKNFKKKFYSENYISNLNFKNLFNGDEFIFLPLDLYDNYSVRFKNKKKNWEDMPDFNDSFLPSFLELSSSEGLNFSRQDQILKFDFFLKNFNNQLSFSTDDLAKYNYSDFSDFDKKSRKSQGSVSPLRLIKYPVSNKNNFHFDSDIVELFRFRFDEFESSSKQRLSPNYAFFVIRQKRYRRRKVIFPRELFFKDKDGNVTKNVKYSEYTFLNQNKNILENDFNATKRYKFFKKNKSRDELTNLALSKRMLRTRRTLVLPAHVNITAITNSFDVIHSWFIPGLGLKMDAIPGRATHHTFYIDNVGFYYGQCAEICGRYHHHMPIRICALPFEHFLVWWQSFGLPKLLFNKNFRRYTYSYGSRKYVW